MRVKGGRLKVRNGPWVIVDKFASNYLTRCGTKRGPITGIRDLIQESASICHGSGSRL